MPPFRPANLNKRAYPGNASIIGPTCTATVGYTTTSCCSSTASCGACSETNILGCRCTFCNCPFCNICCSCPCTVCDRTIPSGRWKASEQYEARTRDAWGADTCSSGGATCLCCTNVGFACTGISGITDCKGFFICCGPTTNKWFVAPACTQVSRTWFCREDTVTVTNSCMGACGWFVPSCGQMQDPGFSCRSYWDSYCSVSHWSSTPAPGNAWYINMANGNAAQTNPNHGDIYCIRAFRCVVS